MTNFKLTGHILSIRQYHWIPVVPCSLLAPRRFTLQRRMLQYLQSHRQQSFIFNIVQRSHCNKRATVPVLGNCPKDPWIPHYKLICRAAQPSMIMLEADLHNTLWKCAVRLEKNGVTHVRNKRQPYLLFEQVS